jgi:hypothetical protein
VDREVAGCKFQDERLGERFRKLLKQIGSAIGQAIPFACQDWANTKAAYRFFSNDRVDEEAAPLPRFRLTSRRCWPDVPTLCRTRDEGQRRELAIDRLGRIGHQLNGVLRITGPCPTGLTQVLKATPRCALQVRPRARALLIVNERSRFRPCTSEFYPDRGTFLPSSSICSNACRLARLQ